MIALLMVLFSSPVVYAELVGTWNGVASQKHFKSGESRVEIALKVSREQGELYLEEAPTEGGKKPKGFKLPVLGKYTVNSMGDVFKDRVKVGTITQSELDIGIASPTDKIMRRLRIEENPADSTRATLSYIAGDEAKPLRNLTVNLSREEREATD